MTGIFCHTVGMSLTWLVVYLSTLGTTHSEIVCILFTPP